MDDCILLLQHLSTRMHFITNGHKRFSKTNSTDPRHATCSFNRNKPRGLSNHGDFISMVNHLKIGPNGHSQCAICQSAVLAQ